MGLIRVSNKTAVKIETRYQDINDHLLLSPVKTLYSKYHGDNHVKPSVCQIS